MMRENCTSCGLEFGLIQTQFELLRLSGDAFACPYCGTRMTYGAETVEKAREAAVGAVCAEIPRLKRVIASKDAINMDLRNGIAWRQRTIGSIRGWNTRFRRKIKALEAELRKYTEGVEL